MLVWLIKIEMASSRFMPQYEAENSPLPTTDCSSIPPGTVQAATEIKDDGDRRKCYRNA